ncbi:MAG: Fis family transcriptional regulator [Gammaproteobacteria bacterium]|nr:Fis family transcriptional regulator [Gammaproteobacteria bacterium]
MAKPQSKTQKKIDNNIRLALTAVCEQALDEVPGFQWLTHRANYTNFPASLLITCVFETEDQRQRAQQDGNSDRLQKLIQAKLLKAGVKLPALKKQVLFDSEQACSDESGGDWERRLAASAGRAVAKNRPG